MTDNEKIELAREVLKRNGYTTEDISKILLSVFGEDKLKADAPDAD